MTEQQLAEKKCPFCAETIMAEARKCRHCGELLDSALRAAAAPAPPRRWSPGVAAVLSFLFPGLGQIYRGQVGSGLIWMVCVFAGYVMLIVPGLILHLACIFKAAAGDPTTA